MLFLLLLCQPASGAGALLIIDYADCKPFCYRQEDGTMSGFFHDIITEALSRIGMVARWNLYPWGRCQERVMSGESEALMTAPIPARMKWAATHDEPFYMKAVNVFTYADHPRIDEIRRLKTLDDIKRSDLSVITYVRNGWNDKNIRSRGIKVYETPNPHGVWGMLASKRGDIVIEWPGLAWPYIHDAGLEDAIVETPVAFDAIPFHLLISKRSSQVKILPEFNRALLEMKADGTVDAIVRRYIN